jgi:uncharacterized protein
VKLSSSFTIQRPVAEVFAAFLDVERIATCMPGSRLLGEPEPGTYEGEVRVKVGPLGVAYTGQFTILDVDEQQHVLRMRAKGREQRGAGNADAHIVATLSEGSAGTLVMIDTDLRIRGKVAQFGRGVIGEVTDGIMQTFAQNVEQMLLSGGSQPSASAARASGAAGTSAPRSQPAGPAVSTGIAESTVTDASTGDLDAWGLIVRPMLQRHSGSIATVLFSGLAAYVGARVGSRSRHYPSH